MNAIRYVAMEFMFIFYIFLLHYGTVVAVRRKSMKLNDFEACDVSHSM